MVSSLKLKGWASNENYRLPKPFYCYIDEKLSEMLIALLGYSGYVI